MYKIDGITVGSANSGTGSSTTRSKYWSDLDRTPITSSRNRSSDKPASNLTNSSSNGSHRTYDSNSYRSPTNREYVVKHAPNSSSAGLGLSHNGGNYIRRDPYTANGSLSTSATGLGIPSSSSQARRGYPDRTSHRSLQNNAGRTAVGPSGTASGSVNVSYKKKLEENASGEVKRNLSSGLAAQNDRLEKLLNKSATQYSRSALNGPSGSENNTSDTMSPPFRATRVVFGTRWRQQADILGDPRAPSSASPKNTYRSFVSCTLRVLTNPSRPLGVFRESQDEEKEQFNPRVKPIVPIHPIHKPSVRIIPIINSEPHSPAPPPAEGSSDKFQTHETTDPVPKNHVRIIPIRIQTEEKENLTQHRTSIKVERKSQSGTSKVYVIPVRTSEVKSEKVSQPRVRIIPIEREVSPEKRTRPEDELEEFGCGSSTETLVSQASMDTNNNKDSKCKDKAQTVRDFDLFMAELKAEGLLPKRAEEADRESAEFGTKKGLFTVHEEDGPPSVHPRLKHVKRSSATYSLSPSPSPQSSPAPPRRRRTGESPMKSPSPTRKSGSASSFINLSHSSSSTPSWKTSMSRQSSTSSMMNGVSKSSSFVTADLSPSPSDLHFGPTSKSSSFSSADVTSSYPTSKSNSFDSNHGNQSRSSSGATTVKSTAQCSQRSPSQRRKSPTPKSTSVKMASPMLTRKSPPKSPTLSRRGSLPRNSPLKTGRSPSPSPSSPKPQRARVSPTKTFADANMRPSQVIRSASASTTASAGTEGPVLRSTSAHTADQWAQSQTKSADPQPVYDPLGRLDSTAEAFKEEGNTHYKAKEYTKAFSSYTRAIELCPQNASYYGNRSACSMMKMDYATALADARESVRLDPNFTKGYIRMAKCNLVMGDAAAAISSLTRAHELDPKNSVIINDHKDVESFQKAEDELHKAVAKHDYRLALYRVELALQHATACARLKLLKAEIFVLLGRYREADDIACDALRKDPNSADAMLIKGMVYYYQDNVEKAFQVFAQVLRFAPDHKKASEIYKKAKLLKAKKEEGNDAFKKGHLQQAYDTYSTAMKIDSANKLTNSKLYFNRSIVSVKLNKLEDAIVDCTEAIKLDETYIKPYLRRAKCYMDSEKFEEAIRDYETVNKMDKCPQNKRLLQEAKLALKKSQRKDYYKILGLDRNANEDEIKKAYKKRALVHHPDRHSSASEHERKEQEKKFKELGEAYGVLSDAKKRARYDNGHDLEDMDVGGFHNDVDPNHIFQAFFGGAFRGGNMGGQGGFGGHPAFNF